MAALPDRTKPKAPPGLRGLIWLAIFAALLFVPAGTLRWSGAWAFLALMAPRLRSREPRVVALIAAVIAMASVPFVPTAIVVRSST